jgi:hypothetical protein
MHKVRRGLGRDKLYLGFERVEQCSSALRPSFDIAERVTAGWLSRLAAHLHCRTRASPGSDVIHIAALQYGAGASLALGMTKPERFGHPDEIGHRPRTDLSHDVAAMDFHGDLAEVDLGRYLFAH